MSAEDQIKAVSEELLKALSTKNVVGEPMEMEDKILIPITKAGLGFGAGKGEGKGPEGKGVGEGTGGGGGAGVEPIAMVVIFKGVPGPEGIKVLSLTQPSPIGKMLGEMVPKMMEKFEEKKVKKEE